MLKTWIDRPTRNQKWKNKSVAIKLEWIFPTDACPIEFNVRLARVSFNRGALLDQMSNFDSQNSQVDNNGLLVEVFDGLAIV